mgnify:CR=1 FL=1
MKSIEVILIFFVIVIFTQFLHLQNRILIKSQNSNIASSRKIIRKKNININTQQVPHYQQLGILYDGTVTLPLLGRRVRNGSHKWNYYTLTNDNIALKVPIIRKGRDCSERNGCDELYEEDFIIIPQYNNSKFKINLYDRSPRYIPY